VSDFKAPNLTVKVRKPGEFEWATYIADRNPKFKVHRTIGHAHAALTTRAGSNSYQSDFRLHIYTDLVLYQLEELEWVPKFQAAKGSIISHFPWKPAPPPPEDLKRERTTRRMENAVDAVIYIAQRELVGEVRDKIVAELLATRAKVLKIIQEG
jgi:hypothetical protein